MPHETVVAPIAGRIDRARGRAPGRGQWCLRRQHLEVARRRRAGRCLSDRRGELANQVVGGQPARQLGPRRQRGEQRTQEPIHLVERRQRHRRFARLVDRRVGGGHRLRRRHSPGPRCGASSTRRRRRRAARSATAMIAIGLVRRSWRAGRRHAPLGGLLERVGQLDQARLAARGAGEAHAVRRRLQREAVGYGAGAGARRRPAGGGIGTNSPNGTITVG